LAQSAIAPGAAAPKLAPQQETYAMSTKAVTDASFAADVLQSDKPVLVDFWADWCGPCKMIGPALEEISEELADRVTIAKMDIMENTTVPGEVGVQSIPLMVLFKDGKAVAQKLGAAPKSQLKAWLESALNASAPANAGAQGG
jgi:thioredoxin 1